MYILDVCFMDNSSQKIEFDFWDNAEEYANTLENVFGWGIYHNGKIIQTCIPGLDD